MTTETQTESRIDVLMKSGPRALIALLLWKDRMRNPSLSVTITERDLERLEKCVRFQKVEPATEIWRKPNGVIVALVQKGTTLKDKDGNITSIGDAITPMEDNQADKDRADAMRQLNEIRENAGKLAARLLAEDAAGIATRSTIEEAAHALRVLAQG